MPTITRAPNPIESVVSLDDADYEKLRTGIIGDWTEERAFPSETFVKEQIDFCQAVLLGPHSGDCTCQPYTCSKCVAEGYLGVDTLSGLYKHDAYKVDAAFRDGRNMADAIKWLANYGERLDAMPNDKKYAGTPQHIAIWDSAVSRWKVEGNRAHEWLVVYRDQHFPEK